MKPVRKLPDIKRYSLGLICFILIVKCLQTGYFVYLTQCSNPEIRLSTLAFASGDTFSYTGAMENYIKTGTYFFNNGKEDVFAGRLPHYSLPYLFFRTFSDQPLAYNLVVIFQLILESIATYYLVVLLLHITGNTRPAYLLLAVCLVAANFTIFSIYISPESLSCSVLIFFIYHYYKFLQTAGYRNLLFAGFFLGWLVTLKAYFAILLLPVGIHFLFTQEKLNLNLLVTAAKKTVVIAAPLVIFLTPWTIRNYSIYGKIIPLQVNATAGYNYTQADIAFRRFVQAWGGDIIFWEKTSAGCYFIPNAGIPCEFKMPAYAYTREYDSTDIQLVRSKYINLQTHYSEALEKEVTADFDRFTKSFQQEKPWQFYIVSPFRITAKFLVHSGSYYLPIHSSNPCFHPIQLGIKLSQTLLYWISLLVGLPGIILLSIRTRNSVLAFIPLSLILLFPFIFHVGEARYFRTAEPLLYLGALYLVWSLFVFFKARQHQAKPER